MALGLPIINFERVNDRNQFGDNSSLDFNLNKLTIPIRIKDAL